MCGFDHLYSLRRKKEKEKTGFLVALFGRIRCNECAEKKKKRKFAKLLCGG